MSTRSVRTAGAALAMALVAGAGPAAVPAAGDDARTRTMYVSNLGSGSVAMFAVDRRTGAVTQLAAPVPAGVGPLAVVATPDGRFVYVADTDSDALLTYRVDESGVLTRRGTTPVAGDPFGLALAPDGHTLYATAQGTDRLAVFAVGRDGGLTARTSVPSGGTNPRGVAVSPDGRFVYVTNGLRNPAVPGTLAVFAAPGAGRATLLESLVIGRFGAGITLSPDGRFLYAESQATDQLHAYRRGPDGRLTELPGSPAAAPHDPEGILITPDARHLYVAATGQNADGTPGGRGEVQAVAVRADGSTGPPRHSPAGLLPNALAVTPDSGFLYVTNSDSSTVSGYAVAPDGGLRPLPGSPFGRGVVNGPGPQAVILRPDQGPIARFSWHRSGPDRTVRFDAGPSSDPDGRVARYHWDFGDGTVLVTTDPAARHTYAGPGPATVTLTVTDDESCSTVQVFTGQTTLCNGTTSARISHPVG